MIYGPCGNEPFVCFSTSTPLTLLVNVIGGPAGNKTDYTFPMRELDNAIGIKRGSCTIGLVATNTYNIAVTPGTC